MLIGAFCRSSPSLTEVCKPVADAKPVFNDVCEKGVIYEAVQLAFRRGWIGTADRNPRARSLPRSPQSRKHQRLPSQQFQSQQQWQQNRRRSPAPRRQLPSPSQRAQVPSTWLLESTNLSIALRSPRSSGTLFSARNLTASRFQASVPRRHQILFAEQVLSMLISSLQTPRCTLKARKQNGRRFL
jgi:hypothetical protein